MSSRDSDDLVRFGLLALPLAGLLGLAGQYSNLQLGTGGVLATSDNRTIVGGGYFMGQLLGNGLSLTLLIFGVVSLYAYLANSSVRALALGAMISSIFGIALNLTGVGVFAYAIPALSRSFLDGHPQSIRISEYIFGAPFGITIFLALLLYLAGFVLFGVAIWRSGVLPRWAGVLVAVHAPLLLMGAFISVVVSILGVLLATVGAGWIVLSAWRNSSDQASSQATPRVR
jgi:hypothetical protein